MVAILAHVVEVIVLAASTNALLRVYGALEMGEVALRIYSSEEYALELTAPGQRLGLLFPQPIDLLHPSVREKQRWISQRH